MLPLIFIRRATVRSIARGLLTLTMCLSPRARGESAEPTLVIEWRRTVNERLSVLMPARRAESLSGVMPAALAQVCGISGPAASMKLGGKSFLTLDDARKIEARYGVRATHILAADVIQRIGTIGELRMIIAPLTRGLRQLTLDLYFARDGFVQTSGVPRAPGDLSPPFVKAWRERVNARLGEVMPPPGRPTKHPVSSRALARVIGRSQPLAVQIVNGVRFLDFEYASMIAARYGGSADHYLATDFLRVTFDYVEDLRYAIEDESNSSLKRFLVSLYNGAFSGRCDTLLAGATLGPE